MSRARARRSSARLLDSAGSCANSEEEVEGVAKVGEGVGLAEVGADPVQLIADRADSLGRGLSQWRDSWLQPLDVAAHCVSEAVAVGLQVRDDRKFRRSRSTSTMTRRAWMEWPDGRSSPVQTTMPRGGRSGCWESRRGDGRGRRGCRCRG